MKREKNLPSDPEIEARIVAWVLGEASAFEASELERRIAADPELAAFKRRIATVHGLVGEASRPAAAQPRLSPDRRAKLLATIGAPQDTGPAAANPNVEAMYPLLGRRKRSTPIPIWAYSAAACLLVGLFVLALMPMLKHPERPAAHSIALGPKRETAVTQSVTAIELPKIETDRAAEPDPNVAVVDTAIRSSSSVARNGYDEQRKVSMASEAERRSVERIARARSAAIASSDADKRRKQKAEGETPAQVAVRFVAKSDGTANQPPRLLDQVLENQAMSGAHTDWGKGSDFGATKPSAPNTFYYAADAAAGYKRNETPGTLNLDAATQNSGYVSVNASGGNTFGLTEKAGDITLGATAVGGSLAMDAAKKLPATEAKQTNYNAQNQALNTAQSVAAAVSGAPSMPPVRSAAGLVATGAIAQRGLNVSTGGMVDSASPGDEVITLAPFAVKADPDHGYAAENTLAGSRLRTNVADLGATLRADLKETFGGQQSADSKDATTPAPAGAKPGEPSDADKADAPVLHPPAGVDEALRAEASTKNDSVSTFSLHVSDVSFRLAQAALARGERPDADSIRPEEFYNAFDYGDPAPVQGEAVACRIEQARHPFLPQRNLVRIAMKVPAAGRGANQPLRLTVLLDTSGSMERDDRVASVRRAFASLASLLGPADRVTLIGFSRQPRLLADQVPGDRAATLTDVIARTPAEGGTNMEAALRLAGEKARAQYEAGAQNRIVLLTDGAANLGNADPEQLGKQIAALRQQGVAFDACGVGLDGLDDRVLEALTRKGDGRYYVINSPEEADASFARKLAGAFRPAAENVKVQVRFNPSRVVAYRLIGFEQHRLRAEDFRNDKVDAAELAAEEDAVALYQVEVRPEGEGEMGDVFVRFRTPGSGAMVERSWTLSYDPQAPSFDQATPSLQLAGTAAFLAEKLRGGGLAAQIQLREFAPIVNRLRGEYANDRRVQEFVTMFGQARRMVGE